MDELVRGPGPPGASYTVTVRVAARPHPALLPRLGQAVSSGGAVVVGMDLVEVAAGPWGNVRGGDILDRDVRVAALGDQVEGYPLEGAPGG